MVVLVLVVVVVVVVVVVGSGICEYQDCSSY